MSNLFMYSGWGLWNGTQGQNAHLSYQENEPDKILKAAESHFSQRNYEKAVEKFRQLINLYHTQASLLLAKDKKPLVIKHNSRDRGFNMYAGSVNVHVSHKGINLIHSYSYKKQKMSVQQKSNLSFEEYFNRSHPVLHGHNRVHLDNKIKQMAEIHQACLLPYSKLMECYQNLGPKYHGEAQKCYRETTNYMSSVIYFNPHPEAYLARSRARFYLGQKEEASEDYVEYLSSEKAMPLAGDRDLFFTALNKFISIQESPLKDSKSALKLLTIINKIDVDQLIRQNSAFIRQHKERLFSGIKGLEEPFRKQKLLEALDKNSNLGRVFYQGRLWMIPSPWARKDVLYQLRHELEKYSNPRHTKNLNFWKNPLSLFPLLRKSEARSKSGDNQSTSTTPKI